jgi:hypothetical protein
MQQEGGSVGENTRQLEGNFHACLDIEHLDGSLCVTIFVVLELLQTLSLQTSYSRHSSQKRRDKCNELMLIV